MRFILIVLTLFIASCASTSQHQNTAYSYRYDEQGVNALPAKKAIIASVNFGNKVRSYLEMGEERVREELKNYLKANGYRVAASGPFQDAWKRAERLYGDTYDPYTGKVSNLAWQKSIQYVAKELKDKNIADLIVFADVVEQEVQHSSSGQHYARWDGVTRRVSTKGSADGVPVDFNWSNPIKAASLNINIFNTGLQPLFHSRAGIATLEEVNLKKSPPRFQRKKNILTSASFIEEAIEIAMHPLISMDNYPGKP